MRITAEASFPLDEKRSVWIRAAAEDIDAEDLATAAAAVTEAVTEQAAQAYAHAVATMPEISGNGPRIPTGFQERD